MITPEEIVKRAERKFYTVLREWLSDVGFTPIEFPVGTLSKNLVERRQQIDRLRDYSKDYTDRGYSLEWDTLNTLALGKQTVPRCVVILDLEDYLTLTRKRTIFDHFVVDVYKIRQKFPALESWLHARPQNVIENHGKWDDLLVVCDYFVQNPRPNVYIRELPIPVHTKFIEHNQRILRDLLEQLLPLDIINQEASDFNRKFGLKDKPSLVRLRLLEEQLDWQYGIRVDDLSLPADQVAHLLSHHIKPKRVIIVENLINFLTLPKLPNSVGVFGGGFAVHLLRDMNWLANCEVIYWGDMDAHGFEILSDLRRLFPHTQSLMMDQVTFDLYSEYIVRGTSTRSERFEYLTSAETQLAQIIVEQGLRLEQEHIPQTYAISRLNQLLASTGFEG
ncbi:MAG: hypothetical protein K8F30_05415 [Taibaiella sp.]|nr:hypothetical protein [Taibaiella sp.]